MWVTRPKPGPKSGPNVPLDFYLQSSSFDRSPYVRACDYINDFHFCIQSVIKSNANALDRFCNGNHQLRVIDAFNRTTDILFNRMHIQSKDKSAISSEI